MSNEPKEWFRVLDLKRGARLEDIKRSYRELAKVWHPDRFAHDPSLLRKSQEKMKQLNDTYHQVCQFLERFGTDAFRNGRGVDPGVSSMAADSHFRPAAAPRPKREAPAPPTVSFAKAGDACAA